MKEKNKKQWFFIITGLSFFLLLFCSGTIWADALSEVLQGFDEPESDNQELSDVLDGFDEDGGTQIADVAGHSPDPFYIGGSVGVSGAFNLNSHTRPPERNDRQGLSKLRGELDLMAELDMGGSWKARIAGQSFYDLAYTLRNRGNYTSRTLDEYESETALGEAWLQGSPLPGLDLKIGRQIVVWGKSANIRITDILNPMDKREPGMTDIEDLRLPVAMSRLDYSFDRWTVTGMAIHEVRSNRLPTYGSDYYTAPSPLPEEEKPDFSLENQEFAFSANGTFSGWEASFYAARVFDDAPHIELEQDDTYKRVHSRITMLGAATNIVHGNWLYKAEAAFFSGLAFAALPDEDKSGLDVLLGVEYSGFTDTAISLEAANRHLFDFENVMAGSPDCAKEDDFQWAFRISRDFTHQRLETVFLAQVYDVLGQGGAVQRLAVRYDLSDEWETSVGFVFYQSGDKASFNDMNECNRLFFKLKYSF